MPHTHRQRWRWTYPCARTHTHDVDETPCVYVCMGVHESIDVARYRHTHTRSCTWRAGLLCYGLVSTMLYTTWKYERTNERMNDVKVEPPTTTTTTTTTKRAVVVVDDDDPTPTHTHSLFSFLFFSSE